MSTEIPPAIRRAWNSTDTDAEVLHTVKDDTNFHRGFGRTGRRVEHVARECPCCGNDEMIRQVRLHPEERDGVKYWCLMPNCRYFVADELSWAVKPHPQHTPSSPMVWSNSAECPECGDRYTLTVRRGSRLHERAKSGSSCIIEEMCDDCLHERQEAEA
jgi:ssDNA-binding Zn-finger/Zn-ribbon topoisomerase 1